MRKIWLIMPIVFLMVLLAAEEAELGITNMKDASDRAVISNDTIAPAGTLRTIWYSVDAVKGVSGFNSVAINFDSLRDSTVCDVKLAESWDGVNTETVTDLGSVAYIGLNIDTFYEVELYPAPFLSIWIINTGTGTDTIDVEFLKFHNHPR